MALEGGIGTEQALLPQEHAFDAVGQRFVVLGLEGKGAEVEHQALPGTLLGAHALHEMQVLVVFTAARIALANALDVHAREA